MNEQSLPLSVLDTYAPPQPEKADALLKQALAGQRDKIVVIDDDPTGSRPCMVSMFIRIGRTRVFWKGLRRKTACFSCSPTPAA